MLISVNYVDSDVAVLLRKLINDDNSEDYVKLLTPLICGNSRVIQHLFKLSIGKKLPEIVPKGTICKININHIYSGNKKAIKERFADAEDKILAVVVDFNGYHDYFDYKIKIQDINENDVAEDLIINVDGEKLEIVEEF